MGLIGNVVPINMISRLIGFCDSNTDLLLTAAFDSTAMLGSMLTYDELMDTISRTDEVQAWLTGQLASAKKDPGEDILGAVARGVRDDVLSDQDALGILHTLLSAG